MGEPEIRDHRAVEDPIGAIFDLSDQVSEEAVKVKKLVKYSTVFIGFYLVISFLWFIGTLFQGNILFATFFLILFILGFVSLRLLRRMNSFFAYYVMRQKAIRSVREADPVVHIPQGASAADRALSMLQSTIPWFNNDMSNGSAMVANQGILQGASSTFYTFDRAITRKPSFSERWLSGKHGYAIAIKVLDHTPHVNDLVAMEKAAQDITLKIKTPFYRLIVIWPQSEEGVGDDVYDFSTRHLVTSHLGHLRKRTYTAPVELWGEGKDGTYDFIPFMSRQ